MKHFRMTHGMRPLRGARTREGVKKNTPSAAPADGGANKIEEKIGARFFGALFQRLIYSGS
jgi:hypothetical protein